MQALPSDPRVAFHEYVAVDDDVETTGDFSERDILDLLTRKVSNEDQADDGDCGKEDELEEEEPEVTEQEARKALATSVARSSYGQVDQSQPKSRPT